MAVLDEMVRAVEEDVSGLGEGLQPAELSRWYGKLVYETIDMAPPWLEDKVKVVQDDLLPMKFRLDISKRAVRYFMMAVENNYDMMPYTTRLYFLKVQEILSAEMDRPLV